METLLSSHSSSSYDANNPSTRYELDEDQDGIPEYIKAYKYNHHGKRIEYKKGLDGNGLVDKVWQADYHIAVLDKPWDLILEQL